MSTSRSFHGLPRISVQVWLGERERVLDQFEARFGVVGNDDFHNIESEEDVGIIEHSKPGKCAARNSLSFVAIHGFYRAAEIFAASGLYFNKHQCVIVTTDNINLTAAATAEIAEENLVTVTLEVAAR
jgi:hypothetical protein